jgi:lactoylglutathione lyase
MKRFYRDSLGMNPVTDTPFFVQFEGEPGGASFALLAVHPTQKREIELCFEVANVAEEVKALSARGVLLIDEIRRQPFGEVVHFRDPEGNLFSMLEPDASVAGSAGFTAAAAREASGGGATAVAVSAMPRLSAAMVNTEEMVTARAFYREKLGLKLRIDSPGWAEFDTGPTMLALHPRMQRPDRERHHGQPITLGFAINDLIVWSDQARERGVHFSSSPSDEGYGLFADTVDPDGNEITFREPAAVPGIEEQLAEEYEDDTTPHQVGIRKPVKKGARAVSRVAVRPEYHTDGAAKVAAPRRAKKVAVRPRGTRGAGPEGSRLKPKRTADPKRARTRPATGRLKKAERRTLSSKKQDVARVSKGKPVKRAVARAGKSKLAKRVVARGSRKR